MPRLVTLAALAVVSFSLAGCGTRREPETLRSTLADGEWLLVVDQSLAEKLTRIPAEPLPDSAYGHEPAAMEYRIRVSDGGRRVEVVEPRVAGELIVALSDRLDYDLVEGAFAGGRFIVRRDGSDLRAELTFYGSGVPIVSSQRGKLTKVG